MPKRVDIEKKILAISLYRKFLIVFNTSIVLSTIILLAGLILTGYNIYGEEFITKRIGIVETLIKFAPAIVIFALALIAISTANVFWFRKQIIYPITVIEDAIEAIRQGNFDKRINLKTGDEFQKIAEAFNQMMDKLSTLIQTEEEKREMQNNIIKFLQVMTSASEGDLTKRAEVTPDVFGSLADAFNLMADGLSQLVNEVQNSANDVGEKTVIINEIITKLKTGAQIQKNEIEKIASMIAESSEIASSTTEKTMVATDVSKEALEAINKGNEIITETMSSIQLIRAAVQVINRRMKLLSEKLMEIGTISSIISEIANRTNLLALNASLEAARAGEEGKGFIVIAEEIRGLADRTAKSSKNISEILTSIQEEASLVTKHLEEETNYVEVGTKMVTETTSIFEKIDSIIRKIGDIILDINEFAKKQKNITFDEVSSIDEVKKVTENITTITEELTTLSQSLSKTSKELIEVTGRFKV
ncbi:MAG: methyl-accepting chemotaxis protein [Thermodesulfovibrio sp.]|uniref:methyl-accepting chemotaxis protein n=1 Tax=unclassified Thermodesulfovibrio TaxID=2645936 RepID=UPI00083B589F|nr:MULTISPECIES: methyl-accepting chemotaxis protein [unclassified Thermodesulfovibrio]MDI1470959.1 methyl-accepting chemotaxis protein [Thermodesulfovibrio sp. 1176]MDI6713809.1 methyl-accepting chemotaxis protein [Thermodesulfovibrio sp.]ODA43638.1 Methyl-accepting chemotaxis protein [Thermodesulfovibrio sp. N1]